MSKRKSYDDFINYLVDIGAIASSVAEEHFYHDLDIPWFKIAVILSDRLDIANENVDRLNKLVKGGNDE